MRQTYQEIIDFMTSGPSLEDILDYRPPQHTQDRIRQLIDASRDGELTPQEERELEEYMRIEYFLSKLKKRARRRLATI